MRGKILIVDDELDIIDALQSILLSEGYEVLSCGDGVECLETLKREAFDLLLLDVMMPRLSGLEALKQLRTSMSSEKLPVILMSAAPPRVPQNEYGWDRFLKKPFEITQLLDIVEELLPEARQP